MRSVYGKECELHPELAGRRYLPNLACIKCHSIQNKERHAARKAAIDELIDSAIEATQTPRLTAAIKAMGKKYAAQDIK